MPLMGLSWVTQMVKTPPAHAGDRVLSLGLEDPLEEGTATTAVFFLNGESPLIEVLTGIETMGFRSQSMTE